MFSPALVYITAVISPGPNFILVSRFAASNSILSGIGASLGIWCVGLIFSTSSILGLALLLNQFPALSRIASILGAIYLLYIAFLLIKSALLSRRNKNSNSSGQSTSVQPLSTSFFKSFKMGFTTNIMNVKTIAFMISIFSSFLAHSSTVIDKVTIIAICSSFEIFWYSFVAFVFGQEGIRRLYLKFNSAIDLFLGVFLAFFAASNVWFM
ncbi:LysE family transporter [Undibacterium jejuense]|uniref:LysE family transporter n=1 Tax=Undibacterium jejuense TaxID=1344949 RepID=A0A923HG59_9BURK|nr:LysE family transporter [Undibacterium jejuense]MBC3862420.1 LysE family transporter [Undibacterium jejuense]